MKRARRDLLTALGALAASLACGVALAQDPRTTQAQLAARTWLALTDRGDADASWKSASELFRRQIDARRWSQAMAQVRRPLGAVNARTLVSSRFLDRVPNMREKGEYATLIYRTSFDKRDANEQLTLMREDDGSWRVVGYVIG